MNQKYEDTELNLEILSEEANEIIEVLSRINRLKSKITRFGLKDHHPKNHKQNNHALEEEIGHFEAMLSILTSQGVLSMKRIESHAAKKFATLGNYYFPMRQANIEPLSCGLCGKEVMGRQWPNTMKGQSICPDCYDFIESTCTDPEHLREVYGDEGYHFNIPEA